MSTIVSQRIGRIIDTAVVGGKVESSWGPGHEAAQAAERGGRCVRERVEREQAVAARLAGGAVEEYRRAAGAQAGERLGQLQLPGRAPYTEGARPEAPAALRAGRARSGGARTGISSKSQFRRAHRSHPFGLASVADHRTRCPR